MTQNTELTQLADPRPLTDTFFDAFELHPFLREGLHDAGYIRCTPIQALCLPHALLGKDIAGQAQTGTGKTAAFLVALINRLLVEPALADRDQRQPRVMILAPTRELAIQIDKEARLLGKHTPLRWALIYGGVDYEKQEKRLADGCDVVIATPGRLIDFHKQRTISLDSVEAVVLDEADRMFDLGFIKDIRYLLRRVPHYSRRQTLLFSATFSHRVLELAYEYMNQPLKLVAESESMTASKIKQSMFFPANEEKIPLLIGLLTRTDARRTLVFVNTKVACEKVAHALSKAHFRVAILSGDVPQAKREKLLERFKRGELEILVATDVAARGLHIDQVSHVFNYDLPQDAEDYVHRIGRTARLGASGDAISFACEIFAMGLPDIEAYIGQKIPVEKLEPELLIAVPRPPLTDLAEEDRIPPPKPRVRKPRSGSGSGQSRQRTQGEQKRGGPQQRQRRNGAAGGNGSGNGNAKPRHRTAAPAERAKATPAHANSVPEPIQEIRQPKIKKSWFAKVRARIKSWAQRLPMPGRRR